MRGPPAMAVPLACRFLKMSLAQDSSARETTPVGIRVKPLTAAIGAEIEGVKLSGDLDDADVAAIRQALLDHLVIFFRGQPISDEEHLAFALRFGPLSVPPLATRYQDRPTVTVLDQVNPKGEGADEWHSDNTFMAKPPMGSILRAVQLPAVGGDTCFANMYAAYEALSPALRALVDGLRAVHDVTQPMRKAIAAGHTKLDLTDMQEKWPPVEHPVVVTHPETGRRALFVNRNSTTHIVGVTERENDVLLPFLLDHVRSPEYQVRFHWEPDSVAFWDNRCVQHMAMADFTGHRRFMHRTTVAGDAPVGPVDAR
jgi:taurine dioxygenase